MKKKDTISGKRTLKQLVVKQRRESGKKAKISFL